MCHGLDIEALTSLPIVPLSRLRRYPGTDFCLALNILI